MMVQSLINYAAVENYQFKGQYHDSYLAIFHRARNEEPPIFGMNSAERFQRFVFFSGKNV